MESGISIQVRTVARDDGKPVPGVELELWDDGKERVSSAVSDSRGIARLEAFLPGEYCLVSTGRGAAPWGDETVIVDPPESRIEPVEFTFPVSHQPRRIDLLALDAESNHVLEDAEFLLADPWFPHPGRNQVRREQVLSAEKGHLILDPWDGTRPFRATVKAPGHFALRVMISGRKDRPQKILLAPFASADVAVYEGENLAANPVTLAVTYHPQFVHLEKQRYPLRCQRLSEFAPPFFWWKPEEMKWEIHGGCSGCFPFSSSSTGSRKQWNGVPLSMNIKALEGGKLVRDFGSVNIFDVMDNPWTFQLQPARSRLRFQVLDSENKPRADIQVQVAGAKMKDPARYYFFRGEVPSLWDVLFLETRKTDAEGRVSFDVPACSLIRWDVFREKGRVEKGRIRDPRSKGGEKTITVRIPD